MGTKRRLSVLSLGLALVACSSRGPGSYIAAPRSQAETGVLAAGLTESQAERLESQGARLRVLNRESGMYEIFDLDSSTIFKEAPTALIEQNRYFEKATCEADEAPAPTTGNKAPLPQCRELEALTGVKVRIQLERQNLPNIILKDGASKTVSVEVLPAQEHKYQVKMLRAPTGSQTIGLSSTNQPLALVPDELGGYILGVAVHIPALQLTCIEIERFGVTENVPYQRPLSPPPALAALERVRTFEHLGALHMENVWPNADGEGVTIAIVDTGVHFNHPDLSANILENPSDPVNGRDDDGNGFVDDVVGWDFANGDANPWDDDMHGSHVAGLAAGNTGVAPKAKILPVKVLNAFGGGDLGSIAAGIMYAADRGARIINLSLGGNADEESVKMLAHAATYASRKGALLVVAAGNECQNVDAEPVYPAALTNANIVTVAATSNLGEITDYSNYGIRQVDLAAPGGTSEQGLLSTSYANSKNRRYVRAAGTSMATPVTAGLAALVLSQRLEAKHTVVKQILMSTVTPMANLKGKVLTGGMINPQAAVKAAKDPGILLQLRGWWNSINPL